MSCVHHWHHRFKLTKRRGGGDREGGCRYYSITGEDNWTTELTHRLSLPQLPQTGPTIPTHIPRHPGSYHDNRRQQQTCKQRLYNNKISQTWGKKHQKTSAVGDRNTLKYRSNLYIYMYMYIQMLYNYMYKLS